MPPRRWATSVAIWDVLHKVPNGYCPHHATGVAYPAWGVADE